MKFLNADEFEDWWLSDSITDEQRAIAGKVVYSVEKFQKTEAIPTDDIKKLINVITKDAREKDTTFYRSVLLAMAELNMWLDHYPEMDASEVLGMPLPKEYRKMTFKDFVESELATSSGYKHAVLSEVLKKWREENGGN